MKQKDWAIDVNKIKVQRDGQDISCDEKLALLSLKEPLLLSTRSSCTV